MILPPISTISQTSEYISLSAKSPYQMKEETEVLISRRMLEDLEKHGPERKFYDSLCIPDILESPTVIFAGLNRNTFHDGLCYSCFPAYRWLDEHHKMPLPARKVFLVYLFSLGNNLFVLDWNWRFASNANVGYPENWQTDYQRRIWPQIS